MHQISIFDDIRYSMAQNSRASEIRRVLPLCVRRLSAQAAELLASMHADLPAQETSPLRQVIEMAKWVVIGSSVAIEMKSTSTTHSTSPSLSSFSISVAASPSLLHQALNPLACSNSTDNSPKVNALESTQDLLVFWENVATNCTDASGTSFSFSYLFAFLTWCFSSWAM